MKRSVRPFLAAFVAYTALLTGCAVVSPSEPSMQYDLGPLHAVASSGLPSVPPIRIGSVIAPAWLDSNAMYYRLNYANDQQPHPYARARWTMPPAQLLQQEMKARIAAGGGVVLSPSDGGNDAPLLQIEVDNFTQSFSSPVQSSGQIDLRASVFNGRKLVAQKSFSAQAPAPSADAAGGARALAAASDAAVADIIRWLASLDLK